MTLSRPARSTPQHRALARTLLSIPLAFGVLAAASPPASAQNPGTQQAGTTAPPCSTTADMAPAQLYGRWQLSLWPQTAAAPDPRAISGTVRFERHPEFPVSVRGRLQRQGNGQTAEALVSGDVIGGEFNLDESADGQRIDAVWTGDVSPAGCGKEIRGVRVPAAGQPGEAMNFVLKKAPGWE